MTAIKGKVIEGDKVGRKLGFPTANIKLEKKVEPGIYAGFTFLDGKKYLSALYVGKMRPYILESHIIDWEGNLYGKVIEIEIGKRIRDEIGGVDPKVGALPLETLRKAISNDIEKIRSLDR